MYKHIMLAVDDTSASDLALKEAIQFAKDQKAKLYIIHVVDTLYEGDVDREAFVTLTKKSGEEFLKTIKKKISRTKIEFELKLAELSPSKSQVAEQLIHEATQCNADLLIMGTHGYSGLNHLFSGSVAAEIIRIAKIPLFIVPS